MNPILCNNSLSLEIRNRICECYVEAILAYGCESLATSKQATTTKMHRGLIDVILQVKQEPPQKWTL